MATWIPARHAVIGKIYSGLRLRDRLGTYDVKGKYFLHDDGAWYKVEPPTRVIPHVSYVLREDDA